MSLDFPLYFALCATVVRDDISLQFIYFSISNLLCAQYYFWKFIYRFLRKIKRFTLKIMINWIDVSIGQFS